MEKSNLNPKKNKEVRRKNKGKWIGGQYIPPEIIKKAQDARIQIMKKEFIKAFIKRQSLRWRIFYWFKRWWWKLRHPIRKVKVSEKEKQKVIKDFGEYDKEF